MFMQKLELLEPTQYWEPTQSYGFFPYMSYPSFTPPTKNTKRGTFPNYWVQNETYFPSENLAGKGSEVTHFVFEQAALSRPVNITG